MEHCAPKSSWRKIPTIGVLNMCWYSAFSIYSFRSFRPLNFFDFSHIGRSWDHKLAICLCGGLHSASFLLSNMTRPYAIIDKNKIKTLLPSLVIKVNPVWCDQTTEVGIIWEQSGNDSVYLQAQSLAQVAVLVAHKEVADRVKTVLSTLLCHCHQSGTGSLVDRKQNIIYHIIVMSLQIHCVQNLY